MSTNTPIPQEGTATEHAPYTEHVEPPEQGGEPYVRCEGCGRELLTSLGGRERLAHPPACPNAEN
jgi:hypothetical protein